MELWQFGRQLMVGWQRRFQLKEQLVNRWQPQRRLVWRWRIIWWWWWRTQLWRWRRRWWRWLTRPTLRACLHGGVRVNQLKLSYEKIEGAFARSYAHACCERVDGSKLYGNCADV